MGRLKHIAIYILVALALISCASSKESSMEKLNPTVYYKPVIEQKDQTCHVRDEVDLVSSKDQKIMSVCPDVFDRCLMQGSCIIQKEKSWISINYHSKKNGQFRFLVIDRTKCPYGYGVKGLCLDPYFSIAADLEFFSVGEVIFVPALVGLKLPTGEVHDGFLIVRDKGGAIKGPRRFDFYIGYSEPVRSEVFIKKGFGDRNNNFEFRRATSSESQMIHAQRGYPGIKEELMRKSPF